MISPEKSGLIYRKRTQSFSPPAALEDTESTEKEIQMSSSVLSVSSNDRREWVVKKFS